MSSSSVSAYAMCTCIARFFITHRRVRCSTAGPTSSDVQTWSANNTGSYIRRSSYDGKRQIAETPGGLWAPFRVHHIHYLLTGTKQSIINSYRVYILQLCIPCSDENRINTTAAAYHTSINCLLLSSHQFCLPNDISSTPPVSFLILHSLLFITSYHKDESFWFFILEIKLRGHRQWGRKTKAR